MVAMTVTDVAKSVGISTETVYQAIRDGDLDAIRIGAKGGAIRVRPEALSDWLDRRPAAKVAES